MAQFTQNKQDIKDIFFDVFTASVIEGTIFCAHAGLSPHLYDLDLVSSNVVCINKESCVKFYSSGVQGTQAVLR